MFYQIGLMALMTYSLPQEIGEVDAIAVLPGMGEQWRVAKAVSEWNQSESARYFLVCGVYEAEDTFDKLNEQRLMRSSYGLYRTEGLVIQESANHTKDQADWIVSEIRHRNIGSLALYAPSYHLLRAYATTVKSMNRADIRIPIVPMPTRISPESVSAETNMDMWAMAPAEMERIVMYQEKGDVATQEELQDYINWSWRQSIFSNEN